MHGGVAGWPQTVPRAELQAVVALLEHVDFAGHVILHANCQYAVDGILRVQAGWRPSQATAHGQLWSRVAAHAEGGLARVIGFKIKAHNDKAAVASGCPGQGWEANRLADALGQASRSRQWALARGHGHPAAG
jgi:hypothetical protein